VEIIRQKLFHKQPFAVAGTPGAHHRSPFAPRVGSGPTIAPARRRGGAPKA
jgi:hypothetical protein